MMDTDLLMDGGLPGPAVDRAPSPVLAAAPPPAAPQNEQHGSASASAAADLSGSVPADSKAPAAAPAGAGRPPVREAANNSTGTANGLTRMERETCLYMLNMLSKYKEADPFRQPVDWEALNIPDYPVVIKHPMDLKTAREKVRSGAYKTMDEWRADMALIWSNCRKYNGEQHPVTKLAEKLEAAMERRMDEALAGAARELAAAQQRGEQPGGKGASRGKLPRELTLLRSNPASAAGSDADSQDDVKPVLPQVASGSRLEQRTSDNAVLGGRQQTSPEPLRLSLKRAAAAGTNGAPAAAEASAGGSKGGAAKRKALPLGSNAGGVPGGVDYGSLELLSNTQAAKQLGISDADDVAFLALWKRVLSKRQQVACEAENLRQSNKKLKRTASVSEEQVRELTAKLAAEAAARAQAEQRLEELQQQHSQLQEQHKQQHQVLEHQRQLLEQQQQVLRQVLKQQQVQGKQQPAVPQQQQPKAPPARQEPPQPSLQPQPAQQMPLQHVPVQQHQVLPPQQQQPHLQHLQQQQAASPSLPPEPDGFMQP